MNKILLIENCPWCMSMETIFWLNEVNCRIYLFMNAFYLFHYLLFRSAYPMSQSMLTFYFHFLHNIISIPSQTSYLIHWYYKSLTQCFPNKSNHQYTLINKYRWPNCAVLPLPFGEFPLNMAEWLVNHYITIGLFSSYFVRLNSSDTSLMG